MVSYSIYKINIFGKIAHKMGERNLVYPVVSFLYYTGNTIMLFEGRLLLIKDAYFKHTKKLKEV